MAVRSNRHLQHKPGTKTSVRILSFHCSAQERGQLFPTILPHRENLNFPPTITTGTTMAAPKPNPVTTANLGLNGETEFVVACKGRPFSILTSPQLPTPQVNYVDFGLCQDLHLRMNDLQCRKLFFGGEKLRILGRISTSVQCIVDGSPPWETSTSKLML